MSIVRVIACHFNDQEVEEELRHPFQVFSENVYFLVSSFFLSLFRLFSDLSFSQYSFLLSQFFVKSGLLLSRFFTALIGTRDFETIGIKLSLKITNRTVEKICSAFLHSHFRFCLCEHNLFALQGMISPNSWVRESE